MTSPARVKLLQDPISSKEPLSSENIGVPGQIRRSTWRDLVATAVVLLAFFTALTTVLYKPTAIFLGQTNQLIVLGLLLSIMGSCTQRQVLRSLLYFEARIGKSTLQNFDAILRNDYFSQAATLQIRILLFVLFALPLSLAVSYKKFAGGFTIIGVPSTEANFGYTAAPGYQLIGNGLSLLMEAYLPFWIKPKLGCTYGFNLYVVDNTTAAVLDAPLPNYLMDLQASLNDHESMTITATVNATVTESIDLSVSERNDYNGYWKEKELSFSMSGVNQTDPNPNTFIFQNMWAGSNIDISPQVYNYTEIFLSIWNTRKNQSFYSEAERFITTRRTCVGVWNITRSNASLVDASSLQPASDVDSIDPIQRIIMDSTSAVRSIFTPILGEYDWKSRETWNQPLPGTSGSEDPPQYFPAFNTRPALVAAMLWARITSDRGPERPSGPTTYKLRSNTKLSSDIKLAKQTVTLQRSPWLILVLAIHPLLTILATLAKAVLYNTPIGDGFGLISLLACAAEEGLEVLRGAAFSGKLSEKVRLHFMVQQVEGLQYERLHLSLGSHIKSDRLDPKIKYG